jgi:hypothetical protein
MNETVDCVVVSWFPDPSGRRYGNGFLKTLEDGKGLYLRESNIITTGIVEVGTYVRCQIGPSEQGYRTPLALNVEIYTTDPATPV